MNSLAPLRCEQSRRRKPEQKIRYGQWIKRASLDHNDRAHDSAHLQILCLFDERIQFRLTVAVTFGFVGQQILVANAAMGTIFEKKNSPRSSSLTRWGRETLSMSEAFCIVISACVGVMVTALPLAISGLAEA